MEIRVLSWDIGRTLTPSDDASMSVTKALAGESPLARAEIEGLVRERLHRAPSLNGPLIASLAHEADVPEQFVHELLHRNAPLRVHPHARDALSYLREALPGVRMVVNSNVSPASPTHPATVRAELDGLLDGAYFSYETGLAKGLDWEAFGQVSRDLRVEPGEVLHIGDKWTEDVAAPLMAGCRALWLDPHHLAARCPAGPDRYRSAYNFGDAVGEVLLWVMQSRDERPTLPVRASVLVRDERGRVLICIGPDDARRGKGWTLPGGRSRPYSDEDPARTAAREFREELGVDVTLSATDQVLVAWGRGEASNGQNKVHFVFDAGTVDSAGFEARPFSDEIHDTVWAYPEDYVELLDPPEAARVAAIVEGRTHLYQH